MDVLGLESIAQGIHKYYPDEAVKTTFQKLLALPEMEWAANFEIDYQGLPVNVIFRTV